MFGKEKKSSPADELYLEQQSRDGNYRHTHEYRTLFEISQEGFDLELNVLARSGWELVGFQLLQNSGTVSYRAVLRRPRHP